MRRRGLHRRYGRAHASERRLRVASSPGLSEFQKADRALRSIGIVATPGEIIAAVRAYGLLGGVEAIESTRRFARRTA